MITTALWSSCHWKTLVLLCLRKKRLQKAFLTLTVNYRKIKQKNKLCHSKQQWIDYLMIYDMVIDCFHWKIGVFQQRVVRVYHILKKRLQYMCLSVNFAKFLRTPILWKICVQMLLLFSYSLLARKFQNFWKAFSVKSNTWHLILTLLSYLKVATGGVLYKKVF